MKMHDSIQLLNTFASWNWWSLKEKKKENNNKLRQKKDFKIQFNSFDLQNAFDYRYIY